MHKLKSWMFRARCLEKKLFKFLSRLFQCIRIDPNTHSMIFLPIHFECILYLPFLEAERMWVFDMLKAIQCPAAPVWNLNGEHFQHELRCEVGSNGHGEINVALKSALCRAAYWIGKLQSNVSAAPSKWVPADRRRGILFWSSGLNIMNMDNKIQTLQEGTALSMAC